MSIDVFSGWVVLVILLSIRLSILFWMTPFDGVGRLPVRVRVITVLVISGVMASWADIDMGSVADNQWMFFKAGLNEVVIGLFFAFGIYCGFAAIHVAGKVMDLQSGFGAAGVLNPQAGQQDPLWGTVLTVFSIFLFYASDMHLVLLKAFSVMVYLIPPGQAIYELNYALIIQHAGLMFTWGVMIAAPVIFSLLLIDVGIGVMAKTMPQMNVYFVMLPLKIFVALMVVTMSLGYLVPTMYGVFDSIPKYWERGVVTNV